MTRRLVTFAHVVLASVTIAACSVEEGEATGQSAAALTQVGSFGSNPGRLAMYEYVPADVPEGAPLVVALHGCTQSAADYANAGWNELADALKFYVVYAEQSSANNNNKCFQWWDATQTSRGSGEALSIKQMVDAMTSRHAIDPKRVFVTGLSAGGAMTAVMLATYPDVFSAGAIMAGLPYRCASSTNDAYTCMGGSVDKTPAQWAALVKNASKVEANAPRVSIWQGTADYTVRPANATELVDQWTGVNAIDANADVTETISGATHDVYRDEAGVARVERWSIPKMGHGTAVQPGFAPANGCGRAGAYILSAGICSTWYAAKFFGLEGAPAPGDGTTPPPPPPAAPEPSEPSACAAFTSSIFAHVAAGRAYRCGVGASYACATGSNQQIGLWSLMPATLRRVRAGYYELGPCP